MNGTVEMRELTSDELTRVSGGEGPVGAVVVSVIANLIYDGLKWLANNATVSGCSGTACGIQNGSPTSRPY